MKARRLMAMLNEMGPENAIFVQEVDRDGRMMVETTYTIFEVHHIRM
jgi:Holliday junction resolvasome RuvABC ATP-dependent DNA helicase subunit